MMLNLPEVERLLRKYPIQQDYSYGTAGFRYAHEILPPVMVRVGLLCAILPRDASIGVMVTASHNDESYNGVKVADVDGGMMAPDGEALAVELVNERNIPVLIERLEQSSSSGRVVHIGRDTRAHSPLLTSLLIKTIEACGLSVVDHGVVTTPQLHYCVGQANQSKPTYAPTVAGYMQQLSSAYHKLVTAAPVSKLPVLTVDCACGVGYPALEALLPLLPPNTIRPTNAPETGPLNEKCGSEYVQKDLRPPTFYDAAFTPSNYCASLDGDADRIVFFQNDPYVLLDGDKIACLICGFVQGLIGEFEHPPSVGIVQTAYANGASTAYLNSIGVTVKLAKTGVKFVHAAAHEFDIGIYFEANGHGTVLFGDGFYSFLDRVERENPSSAAFQKLKLLPLLVNQTVGDAISDLLLVDVILRLQGWTLDDWNAIYTDLPSRQLKVRVQDRTQIQTNDTESQCLAPSSVQPALDLAMARYPGGRAFVRPSGTEDVVRVYAEARENADGLAEEAATIVHEHCQGIDPARSKM